jgi:beta-lactamase class A
LPNRCSRSAAATSPNSEVANTRVAAKSGSLVGVVRNEIGVICYPHGRGYSAAVFCEAHQPWQHDAAINAVIGTAAAAAVGALTEQAA